MTVPLFLAVACIALTSLFPTSSDKKQVSTSGPGSTSSLATTSSMGSGNRAFEFGIVIGGTLSWLVSSELRRRRIPERLRLAFFDFIKSDEDQVDGLPTKNLRKPVSLKDIERTPCATGSDAAAAGHEDAGCQRILVSPATALTSALNVTVLDIPPGKELVLREAQGAECYYVIQGDGVCVIGGNGSSNENNVVGAGDVLVVDPGSTRSLANTGRRTLTVIRSSDVTLASVDTIDVIGKCVHKSTVLGRITKELSKINSSAVVATVLGINSSS